MSNKPFTFFFFFFLTIFFSLFYYRLCFCSRFLTLLDIRRLLLHKRTNERTRTKRKKITARRRFRLFQARDRFSPVHRSVCKISGLQFPFDYTAMVAKVAREEMITRRIVVPTRMTAKKTDEPLFAMDSSSIHSYDYGPQCNAQNFSSIDPTAIGSPRRFFSLSCQPARPPLSF